MARILVVEDETDIQEVLDYNLKRDGHDVTLTSTAKDGLRHARERRPDLVLLDLMLPDGSGTDLCKALRQDATTRAVRVMMLTAKGEEIDRVLGFELGADDYVVKPFSVRELLLRVQAVLRRSTSEERGEAIRDRAAPAGACRSRPSRSKTRRGQSPLLGSLRCARSQS